MIPVSFITGKTGNPKMTKNQKRRSEIIRELCKLSQGGWQNAKPCDYEPLEAELKKLEGRAS
jgi:hypothetical protein